VLANRSQTVGKLFEELPFDTLTAISETLAAATRERVRGWLRALRRRSRSASRSTPTLGAVLRRLRPAGSLRQLTDQPTSQSLTSSVSVTAPEPTESQLCSTDLPAFAPS
jgi:hypothetical protein